MAASALNDATMQKLNYEVDEDQRAPAEVVRSFLSSRNGPPLPSHSAMATGAETYRYEGFADKSYGTVGFMS